MSEEFFIDNGDAYIGVNCPAPPPPPGKFNCPDDLSNDLTLIAGSVTAEMGDEVCVPFSVGNFDNIQSMQFTIQWDESIIEYVRQDNFGLSDLGNANFNFISPNKLRVSWTPLSPSGALDDCSTIFEVCFNAIGDCMQTPTSPVQIISDGNILIEITDGSNNVLNTQVEDGCVDIAECPPCEMEMTNVSCNGEVDGSILVEAMDGVTCMWTDADGNVVGMDCNISGLGAGMYTLSSSDENCDGVVVTISEPEAINISVDVTNRDCDTESEFTVNVTGGTAANGVYTYSYEGPVDLGNAATHMAIPGGMYTVNVEDDNGCEESMTFTVEDNSIIIESEVTNITNMDGSGGGISLDAMSMGSNMITFNWADGATEATRTNLSPGTYTVTVSDGTDCSSVQVFEVDWAAVFVSGIVTESSDRFNGFGISCPGDNNGMISGDVVGGCNDGPVTLTIDGQEVTLPITAAEGSYTIVATDACGNSDMATINISPPDPIELAPREDPQDGCAGIGSSNGVLNLTNLLSGGVGSYTVESSAGTLNGLAIEDLPAGFVTFTVEDENGCQALFEDIEIEECVPLENCNGTSIISPNGDGANDAFVIDCFRATPNKLGVYNRWGELVFEMDDYDNSWDGTHMDGEELPEGGYMWIFKISPPDTTAIIHRGTVSLLRSNQ